MDYFYDSSDSSTSTRSSSKKRSPQPQYCSSSYYDVLGVLPESSAGEIRSAYRTLAMKWHPDRCWGKGRTLPAAGEDAKRRFQAIQEAYEVLSDQTKRQIYDFGLYDTSDGAEDEEDLNGFAGFVEEMMGLMASVNREGQSHTLSDLWETLQRDMASGYDCDIFQSVPDAGLWSWDSGDKRCRTSIMWMSTDRPT